MPNLCLKHKDYCNGYVENLKDLYSQFDQLNDIEKGELIDHTVGKYGVEILTGSLIVDGAIKEGCVLKFV